MNSSIVTVFSSFVFGRDPFQAGHSLCVVISAFQNTSMEDKTSEDNLKVQKMKKKVLRKQVRAQHTLMRHEGIKCVSHATQVVGILVVLLKCCLSVFSSHMCLV